MHLTGNICHLISNMLLWNKYTSFDGLTYNMREYFASCIVFYGARKNTSDEQNFHSYYMLNHRIRDLLFHQFPFSSILAFNFHNTHVKHINNTSETIKVSFIWLVKMEKVTSDDMLNFWALHHVQTTLHNMKTIKNAPMLFGGLKIQNVS